eukprot:2537141-Rhodomonas_salina.1
MPGAKSLETLWTIREGETYVVEFRATDMAGARNHSRTEAFVLEFRSPISGSVLVQQDSSGLQERGGFVFVRGSDPVTFTWSGFHASTPVCFEVGVFTIDTSDGSRVWIERSTVIVNQTFFSPSASSGTSREPHWAEVCAFDNGGNSACALSKPYLPEFEALAPIQVEVRSIDALMSNADGTLEWLVHATWSLPRVEHQRTSSVWCCVGTKIGEADLIPCRMSSGETFCSVEISAQNIPGSNHTQTRIYLTVQVETISGLRSNASSIMHFLDHTRPSVGKIVPIPIFESSANLKNHLHPFFEVENPMFQTSQTTLKAAIVDVRDEESGLSLLLGRACWNSQCGEFIDVDPVEMKFHNLSLAVGTVAYFELVAVNGQGMKTTLISEAIEISKFLPPGGFVHDGNMSLDVDVSSNISTSSCAWNNEFVSSSAFSHWEVVLLASPQSEAEDVLEPAFSSLSLANLREISTAQENPVDFVEGSRDFESPWWVDLAGSSLVAGPIKVGKDKSSVFVDGLSLQNGVKYFWVLLGCSNARSCRATFSDGFNVEVERPAVGCVAIAGIVSSMTGAEYVFVSSPSALGVAFTVLSKSSDPALETCDQPFPDSWLASKAPATSHMAFARMRLEQTHQIQGANETNLSKTQSNVIQLLDVSGVREKNHPCCSTSPIHFGQHRELTSQHVGSTLFNVVASSGDSVAISTTSSILILNVESNYYHMLTQDLDNHKLLSSLNSFALQTQESVMLYEFDSEGTMQVGSGPPLGSQECFAVTRNRQLIVLSTSLRTIKLYSQNYPGAQWEMETQFQLQYDVDPSCKISGVTATTFMFRSNTQTWQILHITSNELHHIGSFSAPAVDSLSIQNVGENGEMGIIAVGDPSSLGGSGSLTVLFVSDATYEVITICSITGLDQQQLGMRTALSGGNVLDGDRLLMAASLGTGPEAVQLFEVLPLEQTCEAIGSVPDPTGHSIDRTELFIVGSTAVVRSSDEQHSRYLLFTICGNWGVLIGRPRQLVDKCQRCPPGEI